MELAAREGMSAYMMAQSGKKKVVGQEQAQVGNSVASIYLQPPFGVARIQCYCQRAHHIFVVLCFSSWLLLITILGRLEVQYPST